MTTPPHDPDLTVVRSATTPSGQVGTPEVTLAGRYRLLREIGRGAMGVVYEADDWASGRTVALKIVDLHAGIDLESAMREARLMARVAHPNTVFLYDVELAGSQLLLAMELVRGETLAALLRREHRLSVPRAAGLALQLIEGLRAYDAQGITHRDIKPSNCFLGIDGRPRIGDLGISRSADVTGADTVAGRFLGTPFYSSPEQLRGDMVDRRSDIYALGATLYEMIAGGPPIEAPDGVTLVARVMSTPPQPLSQRVPDIPRALDAAVLRALAKAPRDRFQTYEEFAAALAPFAVDASPAIGRRAVAAIADFVLFTLMQTAGEVATTAWSVTHAGTAAALTLYFFGFEVLGRASPMKQALGLAIRARTGGAASGGTRLARAALKVCPLTMIFLGGPDGGGFGVLVIGLVGSAALFASIAFGPAGEALHDRVAGTRVVRQPSRFRARLSSTRRTRAPHPAPTPRHEPFALIKPLSSDSEGSWWEAEDTRLHRTVWLRQYADGASRYSAARRRIERSTRLRWIASSERAEPLWDAFESFTTGTSLWNSAGRGRARVWSAARRVLGAVADECRAARSEGTLPPSLSLAHVAIGIDDRILLLDRPLEPNAGAAESFSSDREGLRSFFRVLVCTLVGGKVFASTEAADRDLLVRLPIGDHEMVAGLWDASRDPLEVLAPASVREHDPHADGIDLNGRSRALAMAAAGLIGLAAWLAVLEFSRGVTAGLHDALNDQATGATPLPPAPHTWSIVAFALPIVSALVFRGGLALALQRLAVHAAGGERASGWRLVMRSLPLAAAAGALGYTFVAGPRGVAVLVGLFLAAVALARAASHPTRSLGDLLAGTYVRQE